MLSVIVEIAFLVLCLWGWTSAIYWRRTEKKTRLKLMCAEDIFHTLSEEDIYRLGKLSRLMILPGEEEVSPNGTVGDPFWKLICLRIWVRNPEANLYKL